jgi:hypothetical protein
MKSNRRRVHTEAPPPLVEPKVEEPEAAPSSPPRSGRRELGPRWRGDGLQRRLPPGRIDLDKLEAILADDARRAALREADE